jgi:ADP-ribose pyrophosphatase YjhB (NUDIX family)
VIARLWEPRYCEGCGGRLEERRVLDQPRLICPRCGLVRYRNLKVAAGTITRVGADIVLVRRSIEPGFNRWVLPGGFAEQGETVPEAARRETLEETGLDVRIAGLVGVYSYPQSAVVVVVYRGEADGGGLLAESPECFEVRAFPPADIPWTEVAFPSTQDALIDFLKPDLR